MTVETQLIIDLQQELLKDYDLIIFQMSYSYEVIKQLINLNQVPGTCLQVSFSRYGEVRVDKLRDRNEQQEQRDSRHG